MRPDPRPASVEEILAHAEWVRRLALGLVGNEAGADDLTQEAMMRAIERPPIHGSSLRAWFARVVRNLAIDQGRRRQRRAARELKVVEGQAGSAVGVDVEVPQPSDIHARLEMQEQLAQAVRELPEPYRTTTVLYYFDQLGTEEIAARLKVQSSTVRNQLSRSRARLRERLERHFGGDWRALCIGLLLRPASLPVPPPPPPGIPAGVAGAMAAGVLLTVAWMAASNFKSVPIEGAADTVEVQAPLAASITEAFLDREEIAAVRESVGQRRGGLLLVDGQGRAIPSATVRAYGVRWQGPGAKLVGPERNQFDRLPRLEEREADQGGFVPLDLLTPDSGLQEARAACVVEAPGFVKRVVMLDPNYEGEAQIARVQLSKAAYAHVRVVDASGWAIPGATVSVRALKGISRANDFQRVAADSDANGVAKLTTAPLASNDIVVTCPGYRRYRAAFTASASLPESPELIVLERGAEASIAVYSWNGTPYAGAEVYIQQSEEDQRRRRWTWSHHFLGRTGSDGFLAFGGIDASRRCQLVVRIDGVEVETDEFLPGEHVSVNLPPLTEMRGRVMQVNGAPAAHALVGAYNLEGEDKRAVSNAWTDENGAFALTVEAGLHGVGIWHRSGSLVDDFPRRLEPGELNLGQIDLPQGRTIVVEVLERDGQPVLVENLALVMRKPISVASLVDAVEPGEWRDFLSTGGQTILPHRLSGGRFAVSHLPKGVHDYSIVSKQHQPKMVALDLATSPDLIRVHLDRAVPVRLTLQDARGEAIKGERFALYRSDYDWGWAERTPPERQSAVPSIERSDARGVVEFGRIAPGEWVLARDGDGPFGMEITRLQIPEEGIEQVVTVEDPASLILTLADQQPVPEGTRVWVHTAGSQPGAAGATQNRGWSDAGGAFEVATPRGKQTVDVALPGSLPRTAEVNADAGQDAEVEVEAEGTDILGRFPQAAGLGRVLLVADDFARMPGRDAVIAALRDGVHHELGGHLPLPGGEGRGLPFALTRVSEDSHFLFRKIPDGRYRVYGTSPRLQLSKPVVVVVREGRVRVINGEGRPVVSATPDAKMRLEIRGLVRFLARSPRLSVVLTVQRVLPHPLSSFNEARNFRMLPERNRPEFLLEKEPAGRYSIKLRVVSRDGTVHATYEREVETFEGQTTEHELEVPEGS
jgi:RNA polymerase sigma-70 factor (ECF subfamily)